MIHPPTIFTLFPTRRSSDLHEQSPKHIPEQPMNNDDSGGRFGALQQASRRKFMGGAGILSAGLMLTAARRTAADRKSTRLNSSHGSISYAVFCLKKKNGHRG